MRRRRAGRSPSPSPLPSGERAGVRGFTLIEMVLALGIAAAVLVIVFGGLRAGLGAWSRGEARAARIDHARGVLVLLERALDGAFPYRFVPDQRKPGVLFDGRPDRVLFATLAPPFPGGAPIAFTAVSLSSDMAARLGRVRHPHTRRRRIAAHQQTNSRPTSPSRAKGRGGKLQDPAPPRRVAPRGGDGGP